MAHILINISCIKQVEDGATVKIVYEGRKPKLQIKGEKLDDIFNREFEEKTEREREAIKQKYATKLPVLGGKRAN